jgi:serine/threonine protein phosphatase PrpC
LPARMAVRTRTVVCGRRVTEHARPVLDIGSATDVGRVREMNEDSFLVVRGAATSLVAVADGMGGHKAGEVASSIAVDSLKNAFAHNAAPDAPTEFLRGAYEVSNRAIWDAAAQDAEKDGMGTTLVSALVRDDGAAVVANVGDSRAYVVVDNQATLLTIDHTWVNEQVLGGFMSDRQARTSPYRNLLTRSMGNAPFVEVDVFGDLRLEIGDALVLVSDGVSGYLDERDVAAILRESGSAQEAAERLVAEAVERGGADNATAVVARRTG